MLPPHYSPDERGALNVGGSGGDGGELGAKGSSCEHTLRRHKQKTTIPIISNTPPTTATMITHKGIPSSLFFFGALVGTPHTFPEQFKGTIVEPPQIKPSGTPEQLQLTRPVLAPRQATQ
eukprot:gene2621-biopygen11576